MFILFLFDMNRIDRLSAILIQLQSRRLVKAQQIADKFSISLRTVYRDVHALQEAGVPVIGEAGTGYSLMEGYKLPPVMFNADEATALLTAAKLMQSKTDASSSRYYTSALDKIKAVLRLAEKDHIEEIDEHIAVVQHPAIRYEPPEDLHLQSILKAISKNIVAQDRRVRRHDRPPSRDVGRARPPRRAEHGDLRASGGPRSGPRLDRSAGVHATGVPAVPAGSRALGAGVL